MSWSFNSFATPWRMASYRSCQRQSLVNIGNASPCQVLNPLVGIYLIPEWRIIASIYSLRDQQPTSHNRVNLPVSGFTPTYKAFWLDYIEFVYKSRAYPNMEGFCHSLNSHENPTSTRPKFLSSWGDALRRFKVSIKPQSLKKNMGKPEKNPLNPGCWMGIPT